MPPGYLVTVALVRETFNAIEVFAAWVMAQMKSQDQQPGPRVG
jgi:hypothetical protein